MSPAAGISGQKLADGTMYFGKLGVLARDAVEDRVQCHLCGGWFRAVGGSHLTRTHGWSLPEYRIAFQLPTKAPTVARELSQRQRALTIARRDAGELRDPPPPPPARERVWVAPGRSLGALLPQFAAELHPTRNGDLDSLRVARYSNRRVWRRCRVCGHEWRTSPRSRVGSHRGCPACALARRGPRRPASPERSLAVMAPEIAAEALGWDPATLGVGSGAAVRWRCSVCAHEWTATPKRRVGYGSGCPRCVHRRLGQRRRVVAYERSLQAQFPELAACLHPTRNDPGLSDPSTIGIYSRHALWWTCKRCGHEWQQTPRNMIRRPGCPRCQRS